MYMPMGKAIGHNKQINARENSHADEQFQTSGITTNDTTANMKATTTYAKA